MKYSVMVCSKTGNTKQLANTIVDVLKDEELVYMGEPSTEGLHADLIYLGSWVDKGSFDASILSQVEMFKNKKLVLFGTAGFGGSPQYFQAILDRFIKQLPESTQVLGSFMCQGKMPIGVRKRYEGMLEKHPEDEKMQDFILNFDQASTHPDAQDIEHLKACIKEVLHTV